MDLKSEALYPAASLARRRATWLSVVIVAFIASAVLPALAASGQYVARNTPNYVKTAKNLGTADPSKSIEINLWLNPHNRAEMDALARQLYTPSSPNYRHFLTHAQFNARFAPTAAEAKIVQQFLEAHGLTTVRVGPGNFFVRARGTIGDVESALHVVLNNYQVRGQLIRANDRDPYIEGPAASLVRAVSGLDTGRYEHPMMARPAALPGQKPGNGVMANAVTPGAFFSNNCFNGTKTEKFSTNGDGEFPIGTYHGNHLNLQSLTSAGCGYTPPMIQTAYNLSGLYAEGFDGSGQTIGIIDWCGSLTIQSDANAFSKKFGLPLLTSSNFAINYIPSPSNCKATDQVEINLDVEWAHAVAPGANINLIVPPSATFLDVDEAEFTAVNYGLASVISGSYGSIEAFTPTSVLETENLISETAAIAGISTNFSSGDSGDYTFDGIPATVNAPADSPWATAVGGVTLALNSDNSIAWQAGWGNNEVLLTEEGTVFDPPLSFGFIGGSGGGPSNCVTADSNGNCVDGFAKPWFQSGLPGKYRQVPDIAWPADPFTGAVIAISVPTQVPALEWQVWGGTSLAAPMFSGLWAIANQEAGAPLGQAAPYLYSLPAGAVTDIVPMVSPHNLSASIKESASLTTPYTPNAVLGGDAVPGKFISALWDYAQEQDTSLVISFGTDCSGEGPADFFGTLCDDPASLHTKPGWDNVTGVGSPNAKAFADAFAPSASSRK